MAKKCDHNEHRTIFSNVTIRDAHDNVIGFADLITDTGHVYDVKSATSIAQPYQLRKAQNQVLRYIEGFADIDFFDIQTQLRVGILQDGRFVMSGDLAAEIGNNFYFVTFGPVPGSPQIIQYSYSSITMQEFIDIQDARGLLTNSDRRRLEGRPTILEATWSVVQQIPAVISPILPRLPGF